MAKVMEGEHYYYAPVPADANPLFYIPNTFEVWKVGDFGPMAANLKQDDASLIVDALNQWEDLNKIEREYEETVRLHPNGPT